MKSVPISPNALGCLLLVPLVLRVPAGRYARGRRIILVEQEQGSHTPTGRRASARVVTVRKARRRGLMWIELRDARMLSAWKATQERKR